MLLLTTLAALAWAQNEPDTRSGFDVGASQFQVDDEDDDAGMLDYAEEAKKRPPDATFFHLDPTGKEPLGNDFPMHMVSANDSWVKLELPVLVATSRAGFLAEHPHGLRLVAEWDVGGQLITTEQIVHSESVWPQGPSFAFLQVAVQDGRKTAPVRIKVLTGELPAPPVEPEEGAEPVEPPPPPPPAKPKVRYAVTSVFYRKGE